MDLPAKVKRVLKILHEAGFEAFVVGGCVRDLLLDRKPKDWDVTTNAKPEEIQKLFPKSFYNNAFGTVGVIITPGEIPSNSPLSRGEFAKDSSLDKGRRGGIQVIEVTTYRSDGKYSDKRRPDEVRFSDKLEEDLARRDFTVNAIAATPSPRHSPGALPLRKGEQGAVVDGLHIIDPFGGIKDLDQNIIRAVGEPAKRFSEDALRLARAVRLAAQLEFAIDGEPDDQNPPPAPPLSGRGDSPPDKGELEGVSTYKAIKKHASFIQHVSQERIQDELVKIVMSKHPERGMNLLQQTGLLKHFLPELEEGVGITQNKHHIYTVFDHNVKSLQFAADFGYPLHVRLAALLHDIGKPRTKRPEGNDFSFHAHEFVGAKMARTALKRLRFPNDTVQSVTHLIRHHMFYYDVGKVTEAGARRLLRRVGGQEVFADLIKLRIAERKGSGVPKAEPYRLRHLQFLIEKASQDPISVNQLAIRGGDLVRALNMTPGPKFGGILNALLAEVLDDPSKNNREYLLKRAGELKDKDPDDLKRLGEVAIGEAEQKREEDIRRKYHV